jgi:hypothetical protein
LKKKTPKYVSRNAATENFDQKLKETKRQKAGKNVKSRNDRKKAEKFSKSRIFC